jgi:hypothetical protein
MHTYTHLRSSALFRFNEKIFLFFWFWFIFVGLISLVSFLYWAVAISYSKYQRMFIERYLRCTGAINEYPTQQDMQLISDFVHKFLRPDGVFLLRLVQTNGGDLLVGEIVTALFNRYRTKLEERTGSQALTGSPGSTNL